MRSLSGVVLAFAAAGALAGDPALLSKDMGIDPTSDRPRVFEDVVIAPIPISNPTIGTGLAVVVMPFYHLGAGSALSNTMVAAGVTSSGSWGVGAAQSTRLRGDELRIDGFLGWVDLRYDFYGAGADAGSAGVSVPIVQKGFVLVPELLWRVAGKAFAGLRYRGVRIETTIEAASAPAPIEALLGRSATVVSSGLGPRLTLDTRDHEMSPTTGVLLDLRTNFAREGFGSDLDYETAELGANYYRRAGPGVLALRGVACAASEGAPLFDLCLYGAGNDLRGYEVGRYRDRALFAAQAEYRFALSGRFGAVVFAGTGKVARSFSSMEDEPTLPSVGAGVRWLASEKARVNLSVDVAAGRDMTALYVYVKEAF